MSQHTKKQVKSLVYGLAYGASVWKLKRNLKAKRMGARKAARLVKQAQTALNQATKG